MALEERARVLVAGGFGDAPAPGASRVLDPYVRSHANASPHDGRGVSDWGNRVMSKPEASWIYEFVTGRVSLDAWWSG